MSHSGITPRCAADRRESGFSLIELMIVLGILMTVSAVVATGLFQMTRTQGSVWNRTEMHAAVRSATELLQQEIGQAGSIALPPSNITLLGAAIPPGCNPIGVCGNGTSQTIGVSSTAGMFPGMYLVIGPQLAACANPNPTPAESQEVVQLTGVPVVGTPGMITAVFYDCHSIGAWVSVAGAFAAGIVSPCGPIPAVGPMTCPAAPNKELSVSNTGAIVTTTLTAGGANSGSTGFILKLFGDINNDGNLVYVEYRCNPGTQAAPGTLRRSVTPFNVFPKNAPQDLLTNVVANPNNQPCFDYQRVPATPLATQNNTYVINVTVTLTVQTQDRDPQTNQFQTETKALLNVSPRNVYEAWLLANANLANRIQPMPFSVTQLLP